jgi:hypothetical protein
MKLYENEILYEFAIRNDLMKLLNTKWHLQAELAGCCTEIRYADLKIMSVN